MFTNIRGDMRPILIAYMKGYLDDRLHSMVWGAMCTCVIPLVISQAGIEVRALMHNYIL